MWNNLKGGFAYITALFIDLFVFPLLLYLSNSHLIRICQPPTMCLILFFGTLFNVTHAWQRPKTNNNRNERTNAILRLDFHSLSIAFLLRLERVNAFILQYAIILFNRRRNFDPQIVRDFNCCFNQFWIFKSCHRRGRLLLQ